MKRCIFFTMLIVSIVLAEQVLPTLTAKCNFKGSIYLNETTLSTGAMSGSQRAITISLSNQQGGQDAKPAKFYEYHYKKTDDGKSELVKDKVYEVKPLESLTVTLAVNAGGGIWLETESDSQTSGDCIRYTIIVH